MVEPTSTMIGGLIGAVLGVMLGDPYRNSAGQFVTRQSGFVSWVMQAIIGGFVGAALAGTIVPVLSANPLPVLAILGLVCWMAYTKHVDPR